MEDNKMMYNDNNDSKNNNGHNGTIITLNGHSKHHHLHMDQVVKDTLPHINNNSPCRDHCERLGFLQRTDAALAGLTGLYALILVSVYVALVFTELVTYPDHASLSEGGGLFVYIYTVADVFLVYVLFVAARGNKEKIRLLENDKSHGSLTIRIGAVLFGVGTLTYFVLEGISLMQQGDECFQPILLVNVMLTSVFVILQTMLIVIFPRINLHVSNLVDRFGTMHLVSANIILWIRTLIKESLHELEKSSHQKHEARQAIRDKLIADFPSSSESSAMQAAAALFEACDVFDARVHAADAHTNSSSCSLATYSGDDDGFISNASPMLYPFVIEYALIGGCVFFLMWRHVRVVPPHEAASVLRKPDPRSFLQRRRWLHFRKGLAAGLAVLAIACINLAYFYASNTDEHEHEESEVTPVYVSNSMNTLVNMCGILGVMTGAVFASKLRSVPESDRSSSSDSLDLTLLRFASFFFYLYLIFTIITGTFNPDKEHYSSSLHVTNGIIEIIQITIQSAFIMELKTKCLTEAQMATDARPGRQFMVFLSLLNLAQWIVVTFEIQKVEANPIETEFYGLMAWIVVQRITLPLTIFFRFHSAVVFIELSKDVFQTHGN